MVDVKRKSHDTPSVITISATDHANITMFMPCINDVLPNIAEIEHILPGYRKKNRFPKYTTLPCSPPNKQLCFRGVYDGYSNLLRDGIETREKKIALILESLILQPDVQLTPEIITQLDDTVGPNNILERSVKRNKNYTPGEADLHNYGGIHADYFESSDYVYTSILYENPSHDLIGGQTALVDFISNDNEEIFPNNMTFGMKVKAQNREAVSTSNASTKTDKRNKERPNIDFTSGMIVGKFMILGQIIAQVVQILFPSF